jgi:hypothetical protein
MPKRFISLALALFYLSVSLFFSTGHVHDNSKGLPHQCAACSWHSESHAETPVGPLEISVPSIVVVATPDAELRVGAATPLIRSDRGPPFRS